MLPPDEWDQVLNRLTGTLYKGTERIASAAILNAIQVPTDDKKLRTRIGKQIVNRMRNMGWIGPKMLRVDANSSQQGYWRIPSALPRAAPRPVDDLLDTDADALPQQLENVTRLGLKELRRILRLPLDEGNAGLLRAKVTAGVAAINAQLRADEARLRTKTTGNVLDRLEKLIAEQQKLLPKDLATSPSAEEAELTGVDRKET